MSGRKDLGHERFTTRQVEVAGLFPLSRISERQLLDYHCYVTYSLSPSHFREGGMRHEVSWLPIITYEMAPALRILVAFVVIMITVVQSGKSVLLINRLFESFSIGRYYEYASTNNKLFFSPTS
uniref:CASP-like protein n=1 Tax=Heterorhabditis bacteriophora TaxID=37862 RepID=A0A1I7X6B8_HETBA